MKNNKLILCSMLLIATTQVQAANFFITDGSGTSTTGVSDTGVQMSDTAQTMSSYTGLTVFAVTTIDRTYNNNLAHTINLTLSDAAAVRFEVAASDPNSPSGFFGSNFIVSLNSPIPAGGTFTVTFDSPEGLTIGQEANGLGTGTFTPMQGVNGPVTDQLIPGNGSARLALAARTQGATNSSYADSIDITGTLYDGSLPDYGSAGANYGTTGISTVQNPQSTGFFHHIQTGTGNVTLSNNDSAATFTNNADGSDLGAGFVDLPNPPVGNFAFRSLTTTFTAGDDGFDAGQVFRFSLDGAAVEPVPVPEPSSALLMSVAIGGFILRRRRNS